jgi:hypothetical protein
MIMVSMVAADMVFGLDWPKYGFKREITIINFALAVHF